MPWFQLSEKRSGEDETASFRGRIGKAGGALVSAGTAVEFAAVASRDDDLFSVPKAIAFILRRCRTTLD